MQNALGSFVRRLLTVTAFGIHLSSYAQLAQQPLLTKSSSVEPNLVFIYDDSGSMDDDYLYQYGGTPGVHGMDGPGGSYGNKSPDVNLMYYDPRKRYLPRVNSDGTEQTYTTISNSSTFNVYFYKNTSGVNATWTNTGNNATLSSSYFNPYTPPSSALATGATTGLSYPRTASSSQSTYPKWVNRTDCSTGTSCTWTEERNNYSIWSTFHSSRDKLAKTGVGIAFKDIGSTIRMGWGKISQLKSSSTLNQGVAKFDTTTRSEFYTWLYGINNSGSTPNISAINNVGKYYSRDDSDGPWGSTPKKTSTGITTPGTVTSTEAKSAHLSCRRSFSMLMTDGYYNETGAPTGAGNFDGNTGPLIKDSSAKTFQYSPTNTVSTSDTSSNSMADFAMKYWATDLRPDIDNNVPAPNSGDPFWQNVSFYGITLGVTGTLAQTQSTIDSLKSGSLTWPTPTQNDPKAIDDMWHATLNTRGSLLVATDAGSLTESIRQMMDSINKVTSSQSGVAVSTASLKTDTRKYTPKYTTGSWTGNVVAVTLDASTGNETGTAWQVVDKDSNGTSWNGIPAYASRNAYVGTANQTGTKAVPFNYTDMTTAGIINDLPSAYRTADLIDYLRGSTANEGTAVGKYRVRAFPLGDIVNSAPVFIKGFPGRELVDPSNFSGTNVMEYSAATNPVTGTGTAYSTYKAALTSRGEGSLMVGANDGMFHAFRDGSDSTIPSNKGVEHFAYVPRTIVGNMYHLSELTYSHQYFVDGPNAEADLYSSSGWKQVVVGTTGAGGQGVYALDVTSPISMNASSVLWEVNPTVSGYTNLGHVLFDVQTGVMKIGTQDTWVAIFGNGYESASGRASLFIVNLETGALIRELQTPSATGGSWSATVGSVTTTYKNGLGGVKLARDSNEQRIQGAYAGDLRGNMWRFDLSNTTATNWTAEILFSTPTATPSSTVPTGYPQPITATPETIPHPDGGQIVVFGTGKFYQDSDVPAPYSSQSIYGVWSKVSFGTALPATNYPASSSSLVTNYLSYISGSTTILQVTDTDTPGDTTPPGYIDWTASLGWKIPLPFDGQRLVYPVEKIDNRNSRVVSFGTISPANVSTDPCVTTGSGTAWDFYIDGLYGGDPGRAPDVPTTNWTNAYSGYTGGGFAVGGQSKADGRNTTVRVDSKSSETQRTFVTLSGGSSGAQESKFLCQLLGTCKKTDPTPTGTKKILTREWRQLFLR